MFTVLIADKNSLERIEEYSKFLKPLIDKNKLVFCEWSPYAPTFHTMVPTLETTVGTRDRWRAVILNTDETIHRKNPFDAVDYTPVKRSDFIKPAADEDGDSADKGTADNDAEDNDGEDDKFFYAPEIYIEPGVKEYLEARRRSMFASYAQAVRNPLTRLGCFLCSTPMLSEGITNASDDPEFAEYQLEAEERMRLINSVIGDEAVNIALPAEVICISKRTFENHEYDIPTAWVPHLDYEYSAFGKRNLYFDNMRYLLYDILPKNNRGYSLDCIKYLCAVFMIAQNDLPQSAVNPGRVYSIDCEVDLNELGVLLSNYDTKLTMTVQDIQTRIGELERTVHKPLTDREANSIFCSHINIPVVVDSDIDRNALFADRKAYGLSANCPVDDEHKVWGTQYEGSRKTLRLLLKQPRRAVKRAVSDLRALCTAEDDKALLINEFQLEDLEEHIENEERAMVNTHTSDIFDTDGFDKRMQEEDKNVRNKIDTRMRRITTVAVGGTALLLFLLGFLPLLFGNMAEKNSVLVSLLVCVAAGILMFAVLFIALFFLRKGLRKKIDGFNNLMHGIDGEITSSLNGYSSYLSHACNVMRGFSVLNYRRKNESAECRNIRVMKKHIDDIRAVRADMADIFGEFAVKDLNAETPDAIYDYDYTRAVDYEYPLPFTADMERRIEYIEAGSNVTLPVSFIKRLSMRREELYDK